MVGVWGRMEQRSQTEVGSERQLGFPPASGSSGSMAKVRKEFISKIRHTEGVRDRLCRERL